jgi:hypothetical protein
MGVPKVSRELGQVALDVDAVPVPPQQRNGREAMT